LTAAISCRGPNRAFAEVSLRVRNTPSQPSRGLKKEDIALVPATTSASVVVVPARQ
jgi:hypothetical protein